jgi:hypothetical protein
VLQEKNSSSSNAAGIVKRMGIFFSDYVLKGCTLIPRSIKKVPKKMLKQAGRMAGMLFLACEIKDDLPFLFGHRLHGEAADADESHFGEAFVGLDPFKANGIL